jgi:3-oxoacyl-[acyl-carrier-protein] synthase III
MIRALQPTSPAAVLAGIGACLPPRLISNDELVAYLDTSDRWIRDRTGIRQRYHVTPGMSTGDLATEAGRLALKAAGLGLVDAVVLGTTTPDWNCCPATAPSVATRLGLSTVTAFDVSAACASFLHAVAIAAGLIATGSAEQVLVIGADALSTIRDPLDRSTAAILADAAGAVVLRAGDPAEPGAIGPCILGSDGEQAELLEVPAGGARQRSAGTTADPAGYYLQMRGRQTYRHAVERTTEVSYTALRSAGWKVQDVDKFAAHQANARICDAVADRLGIPASRRLANVEHVGNTGAASIPLLLAQAAASGALMPGTRTLLAAFGSGLTWGATTVVWPAVQALCGTAEADQPK